MSHLWWILSISYFIATPQICCGKYFFLGISLVANLILTGTGNTHRLALCTWWVGLCTLLTRSAHTVTHLILAGTGNTNWLAVYTCWVGLCTLLTSSKLSPVKALTRQSSHWVRALIESELSCIEAELSLSQSYIEAGLHWGRASMRQSLKLSPVRAIPSQNSHWVRAVIESELSCIESELSLSQTSWVRAALSQSFNKSELESLTSQSSRKSELSLSQSSHWVRA